MPPMGSFADNGDDGTGVNFLIFLSGLIGMLFAVFQYTKIRSIKLVSSGTCVDEGTGLVHNNDMGEGNNNAETETKALVQIYEAIRRGANSYLLAEYKICLVFLAVFGGIVLTLEGSAGNCGPEKHKVGVSEEAMMGDCWAEGTYTALAFVVGGITSMVSGLIGMKVAVFTNARCTVMAQRGYRPAFNTAFRGGAVMGFALCGLGIICLLAVILVLKMRFVSADESINDSFIYKTLFEVVAGFGLGGSSIALFGRVGGGIYTKAADVGADLVGKVEKNIPEDDPRNPATIADNVGDNVGDVAGMGADLFGSFAESTCACLVISSMSLQLQKSWTSMIFPLTLSAASLIVCLLTTFVATHFRPVKVAEDVERVLKAQLILSTVFLTPTVTYISYTSLPESFCIGLDSLTCDEEHLVYWWGAAVSICSGLWAGLATGLVTEYYTSHTYAPVREVADACRTGAATNIIYGLALGYKSVIVPVLALGLTIFVSLNLAGMYGVGLAALGMLASLSTGLTIDAYGPITDNAGGIAEMSRMDPQVRRITDTLDAAGNTTAAIGKGFAIGSAALVSLALYGAFVVRIGATQVNILQPIVFCFLLIGCMLPYWFSAMTMKSVGIAAQIMVLEVRRQFAENPGLMDGTVTPDYERCVEISTQASLREMIAPGALVMLAPLVTGYFFGVHALTGLLSGGLVSGVQMAISSSNSGGAWDNSKKYIEAGAHGGKGTDVHKAAVVGDTVGDPLKDTSGPALNILMKLMAILSLVFADFFLANALPRGQAWAGYE